MTHQHEWGPWLIEPYFPTYLARRCACGEEEKKLILDYDREVLVNTIVYHWSTSTSGCGCGWAVLGASYAEHVADVYEMSVMAKNE